MKQAELNRRPDADPPFADAEMEETVTQEEKVLARVHRTVQAKRPAARGQLIDYDAELIALRDQIREARLEDIPPLIEEMEREGLLEVRASALSLTPSGLDYALQVVRAHGLWERFLDDETDIPLTEIQLAADRAAHRQRWGNRATFCSIHV
mgnify:CR=1 FL=1